jgi:hypothetical protein
MAKDATPDCKACFKRGQQQIKEIAELLKTAIPAKEFDVELCKNISSFAEIGEIGFGLGTNRFRLKFKGIGGSSTWSGGPANWIRYKVDISNYGRFHDAQVFEKAGKLDYQKILAVIKERHEEYIDKQKGEAADKAIREHGEKVAAKMKPLTDQIRGYTQIECEHGGTFELTLTNLDAGRLERILTALTIHHAK